MLKHMLMKDESLLECTRGRLIRISSAHIWPRVSSSLCSLGILFSAVPHRGSPVASAFSHSLLRPSEDLQLLRMESEFVNQYSLHTQLQCYCW